MNVNEETIKLCAKKLADKEFDLDYYKKKIAATEFEIQYLKDLLKTAEEELVE